MSPRGRLHMGVYDMGMYADANMSRSLSAKGHRANLCLVVVQR